MFNAPLVDDNAAFIVSVLPDNVIPPFAVNAFDTVSAPPAVKLTVPAPDVPYDIAVPFPIVIVLAVCSVRFDGLFANVIVEPPSNIDVADATVTASFCNPIVTLPVVVNVPLTGTDVVTFNPIALLPLLRLNTLLGPDVGVYVALLVPDAIAFVATPRFIVAV
jgi:hypothetical protein